MSLWCHFLSHDFQICIFVELCVNYQLAKFQFCRLSLASFIDRFRKTQWWRHHDVISCCWDLEISNFLKLCIDYHLSKFQISWLSGSNFLEVSVRYQISPLFLVMTSFIITKLSNLQISCKFQLSRMSGSNLTEGGGKHPPSAAPGGKSLVLLGLNEIYRLTVRGMVFSSNQILNVSPNLQIAIYLKD